MGNINHTKNIHTYIPRICIYMFIPLWPLKGNCSKFGSPIFNMKIMREDVDSPGFGAPGKVYHGLGLGLRV